MASYGPSLPYYYSQSITLWELYIVRVYLICWLNQSHISNPFTVQLSTSNNFTG